MREGGARSSVRLLPSLVTCRLPWTTRLLPELMTTSPPAHSTPTETPSRIERWAKLAWPVVTLYSLALGLIYLGGFWRQFGINPLQHIGLADVIKLALYPLIALALAFVAGLVVGTVASGTARLITWVVGVPVKLIVQKLGKIAFLPVRALRSQLAARRVRERVAAASRRAARQLARALPYAFILGVVASVLAPEGYRISLASVALVLAAWTFLQSRPWFIESRLCVRGLTAIVLGLGLLVPMLTFEFARNQARDVKQGRDALGIVDHCRSSLPDLDVARAKPALYVGLLGNTHVFFETRGGRVVAIQAPLKAPLVLQPDVSPRLTSLYRSAPCPSKRDRPRILMEG